jgi:methionine-R-sulfoxide reductase
MKARVFNPQGQLVGPVEVGRLEKTDEEWRGQLTPEQFAVARAKGTERPFCGTLLDNKRQGVYACVCCKLPLFTSSSKFRSGTGWPSFFQPICEENVVTAADRSHGMMRVEILCARCEGHLGHVFDDGPPPTGRRYCVNSESLLFVDESELTTLADPAAEAVPGEAAP